MTISHVTKVFAVTDCKARPLTTDPAGGSPTYGVAVDVPGIKKVSITGSVESKTLRGDNSVLDSDSTLTEVKVAIEYAKLSLDFMSLLLGGAVTDAGSGSAETASWDLTGGIGATTPSKPKAFLLEAVSASADTPGGNVGFCLWKVTLSSFPEMGLAEEDYQTHTMEGNAVPLISNGKWITPTLYETAVAAGLSGGA